MLPTDTQRRSGWNSPLPAAVSIARSAFPSSSLAVSIRILSATPSGSPPFPSPETPPPTVLSVAIPSMSREKERFDSPSARNNTTIASMCSARLPSRKAAGVSPNRACVACNDNTVAGLNIIGLRRAGFDAAARAHIKTAYRIMYRQGNSVTSALAKMKTDDLGLEVAEIIAFIEASKRGVCWNQKGAKGVS